MSTLTINSNDKLDSFQVERREKLSRTTEELGSSFDTTIEALWIAEAQRRYRAFPEGDWGQSFLDDVQRSIRILGSYPEAGSPLDRQLRRILLSNSPLALIIHSPLTSQEIVIIAVSHHRRHPQYWSSRPDE